MKTINYLCHTFVPDLIKNEAIAIDCGANCGGFARWLSQNSSCEIYAFEPDPRLFPNLPKLDRVEYLQLAVDGKSGAIELGLGDQVCSSVVYRESSQQASVSVKSICLNDFCKARGISRIGFIKMDIEGAEISVLDSMSDELLRNTKQMTVEFHDFLDANDLPKIAKTVQRIKDLDFYFLRLSRHTWGDCIFINKRLVPMTFLDRIKLVLLAKYLPGLQRLLARVLGKKN